MKRIAHCIAAASFAFCATAARSADIVVDGDVADWDGVPVAVEDPKDMTAANVNGDYKAIKAFSDEKTLYVLQTVYGTAAPKDAFRYYYHVLIDADAKTATGVKNDAYEGVATGVKDAIGSDFYIQIGRRDGADSGIEVYHLESQQMIFADFPHAYGGDSIELAVDWDKFIFPKGFDLGVAFTKGKTIRVAAFQEGNADGWGPIDWTEPAEHAIAKPFAVEPNGKLAAAWASLKR